jgi:3-hydroxy-3-methylglutaryl CoA synthase
MTFCGDREDVVSMAATAVLKLLEGSGVRPADIGRCAGGAK